MKVLYIVSCFFLIRHILHCTVLLYALDTAYIAPQRAGETRRAYRRLYDTFQLLLQDTPNGRPLRVETKWVNADWTQVWRNLHTAPVEGHINVTWYKILHDIIPTKERLHEIHFPASNVCDACNIPAPFSRVR
jgi:hypothetical protein